ncbi:MAG: hypothetical protein KatS3mg109_0917 [Pirellulaceae bacterium]|nr:MAG: hypothetical protein KatS3mg109_0917 [Pirellulaceae bacterium]
MNGVLPLGTRQRPQQLRSKSDLSTNRFRLLELMQTINFGRIECLAIHNGEPVLEPPPRVIREIKFGGENGPRPELEAHDFLLKTQVVELFEHFDRLGTGMVDVIEVKHGLPFRMIVTEVSASTTE